jgi:hypothetical protein
LPRSAPGLTAAFYMSNGDEPNHGFKPSGNYHFLAAASGFNQLGEVRLRLGDGESLHASAKRKRIRKLPKATSRKVCLLRASVPPWWNLFLFPHAEL